MEAINRKAKFDLNPLKSRFLVAIAGFALLSAGLAAFAVGQTKPTDFPYTTWTTWAIKEFVEETKKPDLVFLGSSLMLVPINGTDADYLNRRIDCSAHHKSKYFEDRFAQVTGKKIATYNFALPGEVPSDAALITDFLLKEDKTPKVIVYGVGPRDFMDNLLPSPAATDPFRYLSRFGDWSKRVDLIVPEWQERLNYELGRAFYTYGINSQIVFHAEKIAGHALNRLVPAAGQKSDTETAKMRRYLLPGSRPFEVARQDCIFSPQKASAKRQFEDNVAEYRKRYKDLKLQTFNGQMQFLSDVLEKAKERNIHVVLLAMPITDLNRGLISEKSWQLYTTRLRALADANSECTTFFDMDKTGEFKLADFGDTIHLHSGGGAKLLNKLVQVIASDKPTMAAISKPSSIASDATDSASGDPALVRLREFDRQEAMVVQKESPAL